MKQFKLDGFNLSSVHDSMMQVRGDRKRKDLIPTSNEEIGLTETLP